MNPKRIINLYLFLRRSEQLKLPFTIPRLAALAACSIEPQNSGTLKKDFGASQAFWSITLSDLRKAGLLRAVPQADKAWMFYVTSKAGNTALEVVEETMNLETLHDSERAKKGLRTVKGRSARVSQVLPVQASKQQEAHGPTSCGGETR